MNRLRADAAIIGAGIGGLCCGALLARAGLKVLIVEKSPIPGGRYTSVEYKGFTIPTASWMLLYGRDDPVYRTLEEIGAPPIEMRGPGTPIARYRIHGHIYDWPEKGALRYLLGQAVRNPAEAETVMGALSQAMADIPREPLSFRDWLLRYTRDEAVHGIFQAQIITWCGMNAHELPVGEFIRALLSFRGRDTFRIPRHGLRDIVDVLVAAIRGMGGEMLLNARATRIEVEKGIARRVIALSRDETIGIETETVVSNIGPRMTVELAGREHFGEKYLAQAIQMRPAVGMDFLLVTDRPLLDFAGTLYTTDTLRKEGWSVPTLMWPEHAPPDKHLLHVFAVPESLDAYDPRMEQEAILRDLHTVFPDFEAAGGRLLLRRHFAGEWPCTRARQGQDMNHRTPIENLFNVGDAVKPAGWIVGAGAAQSGRLTAQEILRRPGRKTPG